MRENIFFFILLIVILSILAIYSKVTTGSVFSIQFIVAVVLVGVLYLAAQILINKNMKNK